MLHSPFHSLLNTLEQVTTLPPILLRICSVISFSTAIYEKLLLVFDYRTLLRIQLELIMQISSQRMVAKELQSRSMW